MGQAKLITSILFIAVFTIAIIAYVSNYATDNNANINLGDDAAFVTANKSLQEDMVIFAGDINDSSSGFTQSTVEIASDTLKSPSVFQTLAFAVSSIGTILTLMKDKIFGGNPAFYIVISVISAYMVFLAVSYIWKTFKGGDPD